MASTTPTCISRQEFLANGATQLSSIALPADEKEGSICYVEFGNSAEEEVEDAVKIKKCGHIFGQRCLQTHVAGAGNSARRCPMCRTRLFFTTVLIENYEDDDYERVSEAAELLHAINLVNRQLQKHNTEHETLTSELSSLNVKLQLVLTRLNRESGPRISGLRRKVYDIAKKVQILESRLREVRGKMNAVLHELRALQNEFEVVRGNRTRN